LLIKPRKTPNKKLTLPPPLRYHNSHNMSKRKRFFHIQNSRKSKPNQIIRRKVQNKCKLGYKNRNNNQKRKNRSNKPHKRNQLHNPRRSSRDSSKGHKGVRQ